METSTFHPTMYTPATTPVRKQLQLVNNERLDGARRIVLCTEDSIREADVSLAVDTLRKMLTQMKRDTAVTTYVRVRNPEVLRRILDLRGVDKLKGFVIPKADPEFFPHYSSQLDNTSFTIMPILESEHMFDRNYRASLLSVLRAHRDSIECLRIGANDLMGHIGIRRSTTGFTVYDTPIGALINEIINEFRGVGKFTITAPVFEAYGEQYNTLLIKEVRQHMLNGLYGQTVIHPDHIGVIRDLYRVSQEDLDSARGILEENSNAVVGLNGRMDEFTTHWRWAQTILERNDLFGVESTSLTAPVAAIA